MNPPPVDPDSYGKKSSQYLLNKTRFRSEADYPTPKTFQSACDWVAENQGSDDFFLMVESLKGVSLFDILFHRKPEREQVIYGWFGRAVNVYDGTYTYFRAPKSRENQPCYQYCGIPSTCWHYFGNDYGEQIEMGRFLPYTRYPVYRIPLMKEQDGMEGIDFVMESQLFQIREDYQQLHPIHNRELEEEMCRKLMAGMIEAQSPPEQYRRLGLG